MCETEVELEKEMGLTNFLNCLYIVRPVKMSVYYFCHFF